LETPELALRGVNVFTGTYLFLLQPTPPCLIQIDRGNFYDYKPAAIVTFGT
jgi:hypothetical protein